MIGIYISFVASMTSSLPVRGSSFNVILLYIFSITTIESSTTRPIATVNAPSVIIFNVISIFFKINNATSSDNGIETDAMSVERTSRKKTKMTITAKIIPTSAFSTIVLIDVSIGSAWSITLFTSIS